MISDFPEPSTLNAEAEDMAGLFFAGEVLATQECRAEWPTGEIAKFGYFISS